MLSLPRLAATDVLLAIPELGHIDPKVLERIGVDSEFRMPCSLRLLCSLTPSRLGRYAHHVRRQSNNIISFLRDEALQLPDDLNYSSISGLSSELKERLSRARPTTFGAAQRLEGATPGGLLNLYQYIKSQKKAARRHGLSASTHSPAIPPADAGLEGGPTPAGF